MNYSERQITLTRFVAFWRPEKANFSNPKKIAFSERQNNFDAICRILAPWKSEYSESERNRFFVAPKQHIKNIECYDALKKRIFRIRKKSLFHGTKTTLTGLLAFWRPKKSNFFESDTYRFVGTSKEHEAISVLPPLENRIFRIINKSPFHDNKASFKEFSAFWPL